jgi:hypothetical protein
MKKQHLFIILSLIILSVQAQQFQWAKREGKYAYDYGYGIANDQAGNVYVSGKYEEDQAVFSGSAVPCAGNHDSFLAKYSESGSLIWVRTAGGIHGDYSEGLTLGSDYVVISGEIEGANDVITFPGSTITLTAYGDNDIFMAKYDYNGNLLWAKSEGKYRDKSEKALCVTHDNNDNIYIAGYFTDTTKINNVLIPGKGNHDIYVAKYDKDGNFLWIRTAGSSKRDEVKTVKCDGAGNVYIAGMFNNGATFESQTLTTYNATTYFDGFIAKYGPDGTFQWVKQIGGDVDDVVWSMTFDDAGKIYMTGEFGGYSIFGTSAVNLTTAGDADVFVTCFDQSGTALWAKRAGGTLLDRARGIGTDGSYLFITGQFGGTANFGSASVAAVDSSDIFVAALDGTGNFLWAAAVGGAADAWEPLGYESGNAVCSMNGAVYVTGGLLNGGVFGSTTLSGYDRTDAFVTRLSSPVGIAENSMNKNVFAYPNPCSGKFSVLMPGVDPGRCEVSVYNYTGQLLQSSVEHTGNILVNLDNQKDGVYFVELKLKDQSVTRSKVILQH